MISTEVAQVFLVVVVIAQVSLERHTKDETSEASLDGGMSVLSSVGPVNMLLI